MPADWAARNAEAESCTACGPRCAAHQPLTFTDTTDADATGHGTPTDKACATGAWSGPQTRSRIEALLCDARISRVLLDPSGQVARLEALHDSITTAQRRALAARDQGCAARHCTRPAAVCDAHHLVHREHDGPTTLDNLVLLCRRHHVLWHLGRLTLRQLVVPWLDPPAEPDWADLLSNAS